MAESSEGTFEVENSATPVMLVMPVEVEVDYDESFGTGARI